MFLVVDELDVSGVVSNTTIQTDHISSIKQATMDFSSMCQVCRVDGERIARHDYSWCEENRLLDEYHERVIGDKEVITTIISMDNGNTLVVKGEVKINSV